MGAPPVAERVAVVTGGGRNIGAALAGRLAELGHPVAVCARRGHEVDAVAERIVAAGGRAVAVTADVTDPDAVRTVVDRAREVFDAPVTVLVNNAMQRVQKPFEEMRFAEWRRVQEVVLTGALNGVQAVLPDMRARGWGRIINLSGIAGTAGAAGRAGIVTAKSAVLGFTRALALETAGDGVTVNAVAPGIIDTDRDQQQLAGMGDVDVAKGFYVEQAAKIPMGRMGRIEEVVAACTYLTSDDAAFVTGQVLSVNGGQHM